LPFDFLSVAEAQKAISGWLERGPSSYTTFGSQRPVDREAPQARPKPSKDAAVEVCGLWYWYADERAPALRGADLSIGAGEFVALVGANGSGKTTLIKHFNGLLRPRHGCVRILGQDTAGHSIGELARSVGFLFQSPEQQIFSSTVRQEVAFGPRNLGLTVAEVGKHIDEALARFGLGGVAEMPPAILGYGLRRRVTLASLAAVDPAVLVLDEPTVGLDAAGRQEMVGWLRERHAAGRTVILVTHDMALVAECAERAVVLGQGQVIADGSPADIFEQPELLQRASLAPPPVVVLARSLRPFGLAGDCLTVEALTAELASLGSRA
jgi:energy-coupling factor transporter ATP-binding protein EcfA2